jgi:hypothetical protein
MAMRWRTMPDIQGVISDDVKPLFGYFLPRLRRAAKPAGTARRPRQQVIVIVSDSMLSANRAAGGAAGVSGTSGIGSGGGISNQVNVPGHTADLTIAQSMLSDNEALGGSGDTGGTGRGGGIENVAGATLTVSHRYGPSHSM